eukprot:2134942-Amphidinium_carterae.1
MDPKITCFARLEYVIHAYWDMFQLYRSVPQSPGGRVGCEASCSMLCEGTRHMPRNTIVGL